MKKQAFWRGRHKSGSGHGDSATTKYMLYEIVSGKAKKLEQFGSYAAWDNARAEEASEPYALRIERAAQEAGYEIVENPID